MDRGAWQATVHAVAESDMTEHVYTKTHTHTHTHSLSLSLSLYIYIYIYMPRYRSRHTYTSSGMIMSIIVLLNHLRVNYNHHDPLSLSTFVCLLIANQRILSDIITV